MTWEHRLTTWGAPPDHNSFSALIIRSRQKMRGDPWFAAARLVGYRLLHNGYTAKKIEVVPGGIRPLALCALDFERYKVNRTYSGNAGVAL